MLIIEGPDCSGKTTLAADIEAEYPYLNYRRPPSLSSSKGANFGVCEWWVEQLERSAWERMHGVYDRCFAISEPVYTTVTNREPNCVSRELSDMVSMLITQKPTIIFCLPDWAKIREAEAGATDKPSLQGMSPLREQLVWWAYFNQMVLWAAALNTSTRKLVYQYDWENQNAIDSVVAKYVRDHSDF